MPTDTSHADASGFNPRSRMGSDIADKSNDRQIDQFQSTLPHGERLDQLLAVISHDVFQSTLPHGERLIGIRCML